VVRRLVTTLRETIFVKKELGGDPWVHENFAGGPILARSGDTISCQQAILAVLKS
jgi:hypothetical protein